MTKELKAGNYTWLKALSSDMEKQEMVAFLMQIDGLTAQFYRELTDSVLEVSIQANRDIVNELKGDQRMCQALLEIMEPEIHEIKKRERILGAIETLRRFGQNDMDIKKAIIEQYHLTEIEAAAYL